jgi:hypothetical protein
MRVFAQGCSGIANPACLVENRALHARGEILISKILLLAPGKTGGGSLIRSWPQSACHHQAGIVHPVRKAITVPASFSPTPAFSPAPLSCPLLNH